MQKEPPPFVWAAPDEKNILTCTYSTWIFRWFRLLTVFSRELPYRRQCFVGTRLPISSTFLSSADHPIHLLLEENTMAFFSFPRNIHLNPQELRSACDYTDIERQFLISSSSLVSYRCLLPRVASSLIGRFAFQCPIFIQDQWVARCLSFLTTSVPKDWHTYNLLYVVEPCVERGHNVRYLPLHSLPFSFALVLSFGIIPQHCRAPFHQKANLSLEQTYRSTVIHAFRWNDHWLRHFLWIP